MDGHLTQAASTEQAVHALRLLSIDQVEQARSGHPGLPMGAAAMAYALWARVRSHHPGQPEWWNRDRFVLSAGHGSALLYSLLHLFGYSLTLEDLRSFRQYGSRTPGHPEHNCTPGVDATTGPLGQGVANGVGMAIAETHLAAMYNRVGFPVVNHTTYVLCSDGDLMEGVASEACSLAGHLGLGKLIMLYDANDVTLDGPLADSYSEDTAGRFTAYGWQVLHVADGNDVDAVTAALQAAQQDVTRPSLIIARTVIGYGSPGRAGTAEAHGKPLGSEEAAKVREAYAWPHTEAFYVPPSVAQHFDQLRQGLVARYEEWQALWMRYQQEFPTEAAALQRAMDGEFPTDWQKDLPTFAGRAKLSTRSASAEVLGQVGPHAPWLMGGAADLASSNLTRWKDAVPFSALARHGRMLCFGVREHAMGAMLNGLMLHGGLRVFGGTFLAFSDYLRPAIRLAALSRLPVIYVFTHDSLAVGEDGPTHQPVEQLAALRVIPGLTVFRPADAHETVAAWKYALGQKEGPVALILSRQDLPVLAGAIAPGAEGGVARGGYVLSDAKQPEGIFLATGSEVGLALAAQAVLREQGVAVRVVSLPSWERFLAQPRAYRDEVLPPALAKRIAIEAASPFGWERFLGSQGSMLGVTAYGDSAPGDLLLRERGFTVEEVLKRWQQLKG